MNQITTYKNRPTRVYINLSALRNNLDYIKEQIEPETMIMGMVKANAYGHGILKISQELLANGVNYLGVAYLEEAIFLRENNITAPILVVGAINTDQIEDFLKYDIDITSSSLDKSLAIQQVAQRLNKVAMVHLKIDTGMERIGVHWYNAFEFVKTSSTLSFLKIKGLFSHLAKADCDIEFTKVQIKRFGDLIKKLDQENLRPDIIHLANSAAILNFPDSHYNMVRPGLILYGYNPTSILQKEDIKNIEPVMSLVSKVSYFKVVPKNTGISYNHTFVTTRQTRIVTLPIGYGDGFFRSLSNNCRVIINGISYNQVGTICMDQMMIDLGSDGTAYNGDDVLLFGSFNNAYLPLEELCRTANTIPYELTCSISSRVPRIYIS